MQPAVVEGVEHQLAREAEKIERPPAILRQERPRGGEVLAQHDLFSFFRPVLVGAVPFRQPVERRIEVALLLRRVTGLAELVAARVAQRGDAVADPGIGMIPQPAGRFHHVGVGVVHDPPQNGVVRHGGEFRAGRVASAP